MDCECSKKVVEPVEVKDEELVVPCEVYSRVVGYFRPVQNWNKGKQQEFKERAVISFSYGE